MLQEILGAVGAPVGASINAISSAVQNKRSRRFSEHMYGVQRRDALADWRMQNEYNSPTMQMARLKQAGLNPNLVYGKGATQESAPIRSADFKNPTVFPIQPGEAISGGLSQYMEVKRQRILNDNLLQQRKNMEQDLYLKSLQAAQTASRTALNQFQLNQANRLADTAVKQAELNLRSGEVQMDIAQDRNLREAAFNAKTLEEMAERILGYKYTRAKTDAERQQIEQATEKLRAETRISNKHAQLWEQGVNPNDPIWMKILAEWLLGDKTISEAIEKTKSKIKTHGKVGLKVAGSLMFPWVKDLF